MTEVSTIGLDLAKTVFQVHGVDVAGETVIRRRLRRRQVVLFFKKLPPCLIGVEACATSHHWARELQALGHTVRIMPANYVKPYVKRNKNDAADAEAICEAVTRPTMRFVGVKTEEQQSVLMLHRTRSLLVRQRTMLVNAMRAHLAEFGSVAPVGLRGVKALLVVVSDPQDERLPSRARTCLESLVVSLMTVDHEVASNERRIHAWHRSNEASRRLESIPGIGPIIATALVASVSDPSIFKSGRELAAWIGLVPKQTSTGGKERMGRISKQGDRYLRWLLVAGAMSVIRHGRKTNFVKNPWLADLMHRKPTKVAAVALANKIARTAWALLATGETYRPPAAAKT
jgi:transposase